MIYRREIEEGQDNSLSYFGSLRRTVGRITGFGSKLSHQLDEQLGPAEELPKKRNTVWFLKEVGEHHAFRPKKKCDLTASDDPAPMMIIDPHNSAWRSRDKRENSPFCKFLERASLGRGNEPGMEKMRLHTAE